MDIANEKIVQAAFSIADEIDGIALAMGMPKSQRHEINVKLQQRLKTFAEAILEQARKVADNK
jgi:hypothetical protein